VHVLRVVCQSVATLFGQLGLLCHMCDLLMVSLEVRWML